MESIDIQEQLKLAQRGIAHLRQKRIAFFMLSMPLLVLLAVVSVRIGNADISLWGVVQAILERLLPIEYNVPSKHMTIVWLLRLPRVLVAIFTGATLGMTGCVIQAVLKNPLASPYTLGVSSSASFGAALGLILGIAIFDGTWSIVANAFIFSLIPAGVILLASSRGTLNRETVILCGVALSFIFGALNTLLQFIAEDDALKNAIFWTVGDLTRAAMWQLPYLAGASVLFFVFGLWVARDINIIKMGDEDAKAMGVNVKRIKTIAMTGACLATACVICFTGSIGFIGLLAPHIARLIIGGDERYLIPASAILGACLLVLAEITAKSVFAPVLLPVGAITALIGGPMLIYFLLRRR